MATPDRSDAFSQLIDALVALRPTPANDSFDLAVAAAEASGRLDVQRARELRWWQRQSVRELLDHITAVLPELLDNLEVAERAAISAAAESAAAWQAATGASHPGTSHTGSAADQAVDQAASATDSASAPPSQAAPSQAAPSQAAPSQVAPSQAAERGEPSRFEPTPRPQRLETAIGPEPVPGMTPSWAADWTAERTNHEGVNQVRSGGTPSAPPRRVLIAGLTYPYAAPDLP